MPATIIPFYALRYRHLIQAKCELVVSCQACRRSGKLSVIDMAFAHGLDASVRDLEKRLRCQNCNQIGWASVRVEWF